MKVQRTLMVPIELDEWETEALKWAYAKIGLTTEHEPTQAQLEAIALDLWTGLIDNARACLVRCLGFEVNLTIGVPLDLHLTNQARAIEEAWLGASAAARREALVKLGAWQTNHDRFWTLSLLSPIGENPRT